MRRGGNIEVSAQTYHCCAELLICLEANIQLFWECMTLLGLGTGSEPGCNPAAHSGSGSTLVERRDLGSSSCAKCSPAQLGQFVFSNKERVYLRAF